MHLSFVPYMGLEGAPGRRPCAERASALTVTDSDFGLLQLCERSVIASQRLAFTLRPHGCARTFLLDRPVRLAGAGGRVGARRGLRRRAPRPVLPDAGTPSRRSTGTPAGSGRSAGRPRGSRSSSSTSRPARRCRSGAGSSTGWSSRTTSTARSCPTSSSAVAPGGVLLYETFARGQERFGRPAGRSSCSSPASCSTPCEGRLRVVAYEDVILEDPGPKAVQRIAAVGRRPSLGRRRPPRRSRPSKRMRSSPRSRPTGRSCSTGTCRGSTSTPGCWRWPRTRLGPAAGAAQVPGHLLRQSRRVLHGPGGRPGRPGGRRAGRGGGGRARTGGAAQGHPGPGPRAGGRTRPPSSPPWYRRWPRPGIHLGGPAAASRPPTGRSWAGGSRSSSSRFSPRWPSTPGTRSPTSPTCR